MATDHDTADMPATDVPMKADDEPKRWLDERRNVTKILIALGLVAVGLIAIDPLVHKHGPFKIEHLWGFYGIYGFAGCVALMLAATVLRWLVRRSEDYYD